MYASVSTILPLILPPGAPLNFPGAPAWRRSSTSVLPINQAASSAVSRGSSLRRRRRIRARGIRVCASLGTAARFGSGSRSDLCIGMVSPSDDAERFAVTPSGKLHAGLPEWEAGPRRKPVPSICFDANKMSLPKTHEQLEREKQIVAQAALGWVRTGMTVGLGT